MKQKIKALVAAAIVAASIPAQAAYHNGDLLIGFSKAGSSTDYIYDLGTFSSLTEGASWDLSAALNSNFSTNLNGVSWGVVGSLVSGSHVYQTTDGSSFPLNGGDFASVKTAISSIGSVGNGSPFTGAGTSAIIDRSAANSWANQTATSGLTTYFLPNASNPNVVTPSTFTSGSSYAALWDSVTPGGLQHDAGSFTLSSVGLVTYVPEPSSAALAAAGLALVSLRKLFRRNNA
jgi:hypothetical protein